MEDTFGHLVRTDCKLGMSGWQKYGTWFWYPEQGEKVGIRHLNGRKFVGEGESRRDLHARRLKCN